MADKQMKRVEVVLALPGDCQRVAVCLDAAATAADAMTASGLDLVCRRRTGQVPVAMGVYGRKVASEHVLADGDRVELYRPLTIDPRERRRRRARSG